LCELFSRLGIDLGTQVVAFGDVADGNAARAWWRLRDMGHSAVAVLEGGWKRWQELGMPTSSGWETPESRLFTGEPHAEMTASAAETLHQIPNAILPLIDSRAIERYQG
jgi:thiosulfate/3-mercaptopyruvate sulfurtransferase